MKKWDRIAAVTLIVLGLAAAYYSYVELKIGTLRKPAAGFLPFLAAVTVVLCSAAWLAELRGADPEPRPFWGKGEWVGPLLAVVFLGLYAATMEAIGYLPSTFLFLGAWQLLVERVNWKRATMVTILGTAGMYILFVQLLGVAVPESVFGL
ncbi:MAG TPA: tripartite tricarboxylate transporter TctB family protein [Symbiobacteriaceae bacterium]|nr:tripartite tricarboxylate transporter TctB family protein [Symbiobacteriaceae bacterium]